MLRLAVLLAISLTLFGQAAAQSVNLALPTADSSRLVEEARINKVAGGASSNLDSLKALAATRRFTDSLKIIGWSDSLRQKIKIKFSDAFVTNKIDSLRSLNLSTDRFTHLSDSLLNKKEDLLMEVSSKQQALHERVSGRYNGWMKGLQGKFNLDSAGLKAPALHGKLPTVSDPSQKLGIPNVNLPTGNLPTPGLRQASDQPAYAGAMAGGLTTEFPDIPSLNTGDFSALEMSRDLTDVGGDLSIPSTDQLSSWDKSIPSLPDPMKEITGKLGEAKALTNDPGAAAENAIGQVGEVSAATKELQEAEKLKQQNEALSIADQMKDPEGLKETAQLVALNHFQGQEPAIQGAMDQMAKYKKKYPSLGSLSEIKKNDWLPHNGLKGMAFRERLRIGLHTGFKSAGDTLLLDFYPNASYRITGRLEAGLGAIYRVRINTKDFGFDQRNPVWGMASFVVVKTFKSIFLHLELDGNSFPKSGTTDNRSYRDWRWSFYSGIQTNFKLGKQWTGIVQMLYNFDSNLKDGFPEKLTLRFGVQYKLRRKKV